MKTSYIVINKKTLKPVLEFYNPKIIKKINLHKYGVMVAKDWLQYLNLTK